MCEHTVVFSCTFAGSAFMARTKTTKYYSARKGNRGNIFITIFLLFVAQVSLLFQSFYSTRKRGRGMEAAVGAKTERRRKELLERRTVAPIVQKKRDPTTTKIPFHTQRPSTPKRKDETSKKTFDGLDQAERYFLQFSETACLAQNLHKGLLLLLVNS